MTSSCHMVMFDFLIRPREYALRTWPEERGTTRYVIMFWIVCVLSLGGTFVACMASLLLWNKQLQSGTIDNRLVQSLYGFTLPFYVVVGGGVLVVGTQVMYLLHSVLYPAPADIAWAMPMMYVLMVVSGLMLLQIPMALVWLIYKSLYMSALTKVSLMGALVRLALAGLVGYWVTITLYGVVSDGVVIPYIIKLLDLQSAQLQQQLET